jgi:hypothetical protein
MGRLKTLARGMQGFDLICTYNWGRWMRSWPTPCSPADGLAPLVHHEDGFNADEADGLLARRNWFRRIALARASAVIVPSQRLETIAREVWHQPEGRVHRIVNGIDTAAYARALQGKGRCAAPRDQAPGEKWLGTLAGCARSRICPGWSARSGACPKTGIW